MRAEEEGREEDSPLEKRTAPVTPYFNSRIHFGFLTSGILRNDNALGLFLATKIVSVVMAGKETNTHLSNYRL